MEKNSSIPDNSRVRLRDYIGPEFYEGMAKSGNEGWIRKHRVDPRNGLPEVYIEWDREHWADNMQPNRWTFEDHFDVIEEGDGNSTMSEDNEITPEEWAAFLKFREFMKGSESEPEPEVEPEVTDLEAEQYAYFTAQTEHAKDILNDSEAFFIIGVQRRAPDEQAPRGNLVVNTAGSCLSPETDVLLGMQLSSFASKFHDEAALMLIRQLTSQGDDDGDSN